MDILNQINKLKKKRNAVILAHNYQLPEIQDIADFVGDSLGLSIEASKTRADVIVFCGVLFMAETAAIISPDKKVIMPDKEAGCPMADMITADQLRDLNKKHPNAKVVCYVNSSAEVKAGSDICCTSANSVKVVNSIKDTDEIIFVPDKYLGDFTQKQCPGKKFILWTGFCPTHMRVTAEAIKKQKVAYPGAVVLVHPECRPEAIELADQALSTGQMLKFVKGSKENEFIVGTEMGIIHSLQKQNPAKKFYPVSELAVCPNMKLITLEKVLFSLEDMKEFVLVPKDIAARAKQAIDKMLSL